MRLLLRVEVPMGDSGRLGTRRCARLHDILHILEIYRNLEAQAAAGTSRAGSR